MQLLWKLVHAMDGRSHRMAAELGVTGPQRLVVRLVGRHEGIAAGRVAEIMNVHPSTLTGVLQRLVAHGYLERKVDPDDGRRSLLKLTEKGQTVDAKRGGTVEAAIGRALARSEGADIEATVRLLTVIADELEREDA